MQLDQASRQSSHWVPVGLGFVSRSRDTDSFTRKKSLMSTSGGWRSQAQTPKRLTQRSLSPQHETNRTPRFHLMEENSFFLEPLGDHGDLDLRFQWFKSCTTDIFWSRTSLQSALVSR